MSTSSSSSNSANPKQVAVIGAGIVGICCALYLQRDGHQVTVFDPQGPGEGASKGNAGMFAIDHILPEAVPGIWREVPGMLLDPLGPLTLRWSYLPRALPWLLRFIASSRRAQFENAIEALTALANHAMDAYQPLLKSARAAGMIRQNGWLLVYESSQAFEKAAPHKVQARLERGIEVEVLNAAGVHEMEPALSKAVRHGVYYPGVSQSTDPFRFVQVLAADFLRQGGKILREKVTAVSFQEGGPHTLYTDSSSHQTGAVVLAAGAHSKALARQLGAKVPLDAERGYHAMLPDPKVNLKVPVISGDFHCAITPMEGGLRVGGTVEFAGVDAPPNYARADKLVSVAHRLLPGLNDAGYTKWMGCRPAMPDSLPVIGPAPASPDAYFAFGHGKVGLTNGAITGKLIAELVGGRPTTIDMTPYRAGRF